VAASFRAYRQFDEPNAEQALHLPLGAWVMTPLDDIAEVLDFRVLRPPATLAEACIVADEMLAFGCDLEYVNTPRESLAELAQQVLNSQIWEL
jgi:hypothetical protein